MLRPQIRNLSKAWAQGPPIYSELNSDFPGLFPLNGMHVPEEWLLRSWWATTNMTLGSSPEQTLSDKHSRLWFRCESPDNIHEFKTRSSLLKPYLRKQILSGVRGCGSHEAVSTNFLSGVWKCYPLKKALLSSI